VRGSSTHAHILTGIEHTLRHAPLLLGQLLEALVGLALSAALSVKLVRKLLECFLGVEAAAVGVDVTQLDVGLVPLAEELVHDARLVLVSHGVLLTGEFFALADGHSIVASAGTLALALDTRFFVEESHAAVELGEESLPLAELFVLLGAVGLR
jgi:hypothetical protein